MIWHPEGIQLRVLARLPVRTRSKVYEVAERLGTPIEPGQYRAVYAALERLSDLGLVRRFKQPHGFRPLYQRLPVKELRARLKELGWPGKEKKP